MKVSQTLYVTSRAEWRSWLEEHYQSEPEIWLVYYRKETGKPRISYDDSVKEALCFGWIDSTVKSIDEERFAQKFSPRKSKSQYSQTNKERLKFLIEEGLVKEDVLARIGDVAPENFVFPEDIMEALRSNEEAWKNFQRYSPPYQRIRIAFIDGARSRPGEFEKRLDYFLRMTEEDKQFGYGIEEFFA
ncbi:MAG TPA: YdeI/OmpD-associated family protein [Anaerolineales bacterium]|nr:YdeI/OmpD-associated family protein [Anaerolineales bacterium]